MHRRRPRTVESYLPVTVTPLGDECSCHPRAIMPSQRRRRLPLRGVTSRPVCPFPQKIAHSHVATWTPILLVPWAHLSPQPKRHLDRFSRFCRAHDCVNRQTHHATRSVIRGRIQRCGIKQFLY